LFPAFVFRKPLVRRGSAFVVRRHSHFMKNRTPLIIAALLASIFTGCSKHPPTAATKPQLISFSGYTNGVVGVIAPVFAKLTADRAAVIQQWLAAGTNGAMFTVTNQEHCDIYVNSGGRIYSEGTHPINEETPLLNAPTSSGVGLKPGEVATIQVALLPHELPWRFQVNYIRMDDKSSHSLESGWIDK